MSGITKRFGRNVVLRDVSLEVFPGEVHILAGENGAGKSTLIKILAGVYQDWEGRIEYFGRSARPGSPVEAMRLGVSVIYQELSLVPSMSVSDNIFLGRNLARAGFVRRDQQREATRELLDRIGLEADPETAVEELPIAAQQLVEIAKSLSRQAGVLVMDEPTSALTAPEVEALFKLIGRLKNEGRGIVYITHKLEEMERLADTITVLRDGCLIGTRPAGDLPRAELLRWMVGRELEERLEERFQEQTPRAALAARDERLRLESFSIPSRRAAGRPAVENVDLTLRAGEVLGLAGLQGSGVSRLLLGIFGAFVARTRGSLYRNGEKVSISSPREAIRHGIALLTSDRKATGLVLCRPVLDNAVLADLPRLAPGGWRSPRRERLAAEELAAALRLKAASLDMEAGELSGGNQQKVALAKWIQTEPEVLLLDEPTRGIDVGAKQEVYQLINEWTSHGMAIMMTSSELPELLALSDRIMVFHRGRATACFRRGEAGPERILEAAMGRSARAPDDGQPGPEAGPKLGPAGTAGPSGERLP
jgi:ABC-type sugar transport system ATPase subunit